MKKLAIVTGANRGIGKAIAAALEKKGLEVIATDRKRLDVSDDASIDRFVASLDRARGVDVLVNNAGVSLDGFDANVARDTLRVNLVGAMHLTDRLLSFFNDQARVVMLSSGMGELSVIPSRAIRDRFTDPSLDRAGLLALTDEFVAAVASGKRDLGGFPRNSYSVSKVALNAYVRILARELAADPRHIAVNAACPGWVKTDMGGRSAPRTVEQGAKTPVFLSLLEGPDAPSGRFFRDEREVAF
jgi:NAD(P)-dependent dehydrogenase (short-subunit alcohol dehydrogenase family)